MFSNYAELASISTNSKKGGVTPTKACVSLSPVSYKANLKLIIDLKASKASKRKTTSLSYNKTPTKRPKTSYINSKLLEDINKKQLDREIQSLLLNSYSKNSYNATRK